MNIKFILTFLFFTCVNSHFSDKLHHVVSDGEQTGKCWVYNHLPKAGGTTIIHILQKLWGDRISLYGAGNWMKGDHFLKYFTRDFYDQVEGGTKNVLVGAYVEALMKPEFGITNCKRFTVFRHPVSRMISAYYYCKYRGTDTLCGSQVIDNKNIDLVSFAKHWGNFAMRQFILSYFSFDAVLDYADEHNIEPSVDVWYKLKNYMGHEDGYEHQIYEHEMYELIEPVKEIISNHYLVGILENFNSTLELFDYQLDMPLVDWKHEYGLQGLANKNRFDDEKKVAILDAFSNENHEIYKYMELDIILYEHAIDVFNSQVDNMLANR